jgi:broad specificity phosphatase PhoE
VTRRLLLVRHAPTAAARRAAFGADGALTARGQGDAAALAGRLPQATRALASPARCAGETAAELRLDAVPEPALADWDFGAWRGRTLEELRAADPTGVHAWLDDPAAAPHGGERLVDVLERGARWLADVAVEGTLVAVTHAAIVRACLLAALGAPPRAFWALDVAPLGVTELRHRDGRWRIARVNWQVARAAAGVAA